MNALTLVVEGHRKTWPMPTEVLVGRDPSAMVVAEHPLVSRSHVRFLFHSGEWVVEDAQSLNGTWLDGQQITRAKLPPGAPRQMMLGDPTDGYRIHVQVEAPGAAHPPPIQPDHGRRQVTVGRDPSNVLVLNDPLVSRQHLAVLPGSPAVLRDLGSFNGTFHNGRPVAGDVPLNPGDEVGVGNQTLVWTGQELRTISQESAIVVRNLTTRLKDGRTLLDNVSLVLPPRSLTAVIGPSGAGKSTLLGALTGLRPPTSGNVLWHGQSLFQHYEQLRFHIGLVPQDDILHPQLTVRQGLRFAAELRLPPDTSAAERDQRVLHVAEQMQLVPQLDQRIGQTLSGGQRKRVSIATELLTAPPLLYLDEPTSGLDPGLDREVMQLLRGLADDGRTVVTVTHSILALAECDRLLVLAPGGRVAYFGPVDEALQFFGARDFVEVFDALEHPGWVERFASSPLRRSYAEVGSTPDAPVRPPAAPARTDPVRQLTTVLRRNAAVALADRGLVTLLLAMPLVLGLLAQLVPGDAGLAISKAEPTEREAAQRVTLLIIGAALMGTSLTVRELIRERAILRREHAVGLSIGAYWGGKVAVMGILALLQGALFASLALIGVTGPDGDGIVGAGKLEVIAATALLAFAAAVLGLALSALVSSSEQAMPVLVGSVMLQLVLSGAIIPVAGRAVLEQLAWLAPSRWAYGAIGTSVDLGATSTDTDQLLEHTKTQWLFDMGMLTLIALILCLLGYVFTRRSAR